MFTMYVKFICCVSFWCADRCFVVLVIYGRWTIKVNLFSFQQLQCTIMNTE